MGEGRIASLRERAGTVRVRTTGVAVIAVGVALIISAVAMVVLLRRSLTNDVRAAALLRARTAAAAEMKEPIPVEDGEDEFVQVVDADGDVVASSENLIGMPAVLSLAPGQSERVDELGFEDDAFLAVAVSASATGDRVIIAGRSLETVAESTQAVVGLLAIGIPALLVVLAVVMWRIVGRALAPVESMRAEVESISNTELHRRVPRPRGNDEVARLATTMNRMLGRLEAGNARLHRFVSDASHELRSPVTSIRQHAEVATAHPEGTSLEELAEVVLQEEARLEQLVDDLLLLTRIDEGTVTFRTDPVDLDDIVLAAAARLRASTRLRIDSGRVTAGRVAGDEKQLDRLVRNLTENAARHAHGGVSLALRNGAGEVVLTIDDDGGGIPASERQRVFERFVRLAEARDRDSGGSGLGLAIVAEIASAHGALVKLLDSPLGGARFEVRFPALDSARTFSADAQPAEGRLGEEGDTRRVIREES